jgi:hypothetical protein
MNLWELTYIQFCENWLENSKYKKSYKANQTMWEGKKKELLKQWEDILLQRAEVGSIPEKVIRSYVNMFGEEATRRIFRGVKAKGLEEWEQTQMRKISRESILENLRKCENNMKPAQV